MLSCNPLAHFRTHRTVMHIIVLILPINMPRKLWHADTTLYWLCHQTLLPPPQNKQKKQSGNVRLPRFTFISVPLSGLYSSNKKLALIYCIVTCALCLLSQVSWSTKWWFIYRKQNIGISLCNLVHSSIPFHWALPFAK